MNMLKTESHNSDKLIIADIQFVCISYLILITNITEWIDFNVI